MGLMGAAATRSVVTALGPSIGSCTAQIYAPPNHLLYVHTPEAHLRQTIVLHRHGDRAPIAKSAGENLVMDPDRWRARIPTAAVAAACDASFPVAGPSEPIDANSVPFGALTIAGSKQCFDLGATIRERLERVAPHLLPNASSHLAVRATNIRRTQVSVQNVLFGLLGREQPGATRDGAGAGADADAFTVPVTVRELPLETMLPNPKKCPALQRRWDEMRAYTTESEKGTEDEELLAWTAGALGYGEGEFSLDQAREVLVCATAYGDPLPDAFTDEVVLKLMRLNAKRWYVRFGDATVARLGMGLLVHEIEMHLAAAAAPQAAVEGGKAPPPPPRCVLYSGHDSTIVPLLAALGLTFLEHEWPQYAASLSIELADLQAAPGGLACRLLYNEAPVPLQRAIAEASGAPPSQATELPAGLREAGWVPWEGEQGFRSLLQRVGVSPARWKEECAKGGEVDGTGGDRALEDTLTGGGSPPKAKL